MTGTTARKAAIRQENGHQVVVLPEDIQLTGDEVFVRRDEETGDVILSSRTAGRNTWQEFFAFRDSLSIPQEDRDAYMSERPMNRAATFRDVFEDEE